MGLSIRKSLNVGPFRFNLSKSGVGISTGVKGFRLGTGPRGNYVHMGRAGFYYRKSLGKQDSSEPQESASSYWPDVEPIGSDIDSMAEFSLSEIAREMNSKRRSLGMKTVALCFSIILILLGVYLATLDYWWPFAAAIVVTVIATTLAAIYDSQNRIVVVMYDLEPAFEAAYSDLCGAVSDLRHSNSLFSVTGRTHPADSSVYFTKGSATVSRQLPKGLRCNVEPPSISFMQHAFYFLPDCILSSNGSIVSSVGYEELHMDIAKVPIQLQDFAPSDAKVLRERWTHARVDGGRDRRYKQNPLIIVCEFEQLSLRSQTGVNEVLMISKAGLAEPLVEQIGVMISEIKIGKEKRLAADLEARRLAEIDAKRPHKFNSAVLQTLAVAIAMDGKIEGKEELLVYSVVSKLDTGWSKDKFRKQYQAAVEAVSIRGVAQCYRDVVDLAGTIETKERQDFLLQAIKHVAGAEKIANRICHDLKARFPD